MVAYLDRVNSSNYRVIQLNYAWPRLRCILVLNVCSSWPTGSPGLLQKFGARMSGPKREGSFGGKKAVKTSFPTHGSGSVHDLHFTCVISRLMILCVHYFSVIWFCQHSLDDQYLIFSIALGLDF